MATSEDLPVPLVIICLLLVRGSSPLPTASPFAEVNPKSSQELSTEDYNQLEDIDVTAATTSPRVVSPEGRTFQLCNYNSCLENQTPCSELAASSGCWCPGISSPKKIPAAPRVHSVSWNGSEVVVQWCAPNSHVTSYTVTVGGEVRQNFNKDKRSGGVGNIDHITEVCVVSVNDAGNSEGACMMYHPRDSSLPLKAGLIGGALGFLLLLLLAVLLWRHKRQRKHEASISMHDTGEPQ